MSTPVSEQRREANDRAWPAIQRGAIGTTGVIIAAGSCVLFGGLPGALAGGGVLLGGLVLPAPAGFGVALAGVLVLAETAPVVSVGAGGVLLSIFVDATITYPQTARRHVLVGMLATGVALGMVTAVLVDSWPLGQVAVGLVLIVGGSLYIFHRFTRVKLGLETGDEQ